MAASVTWGAVIEKSHLVMVKIRKVVYGFSTIHVCHCLWQPLQATA
jgi:hypothetical protein